MGSTAFQQTMIAAALDIGTNTLLMAIADLSPDALLGGNPQNVSGQVAPFFSHSLIRKVIADEHRIARLGEGVDRSQWICQAAIERASAIIREYRSIADAAGATARIAVGTSVFRAARNGAEVARILGMLWGAPVEVLSGQEEAELCYRGTVYHRERAAVLDIGGGSTELTIGEHSRILARNSIELGAVRLAERFWRSYPAPQEALNAAWQLAVETLAPFAELPAVERMYAVAGTPTTLALMAQDLQHNNWQRAEGYILKRTAIERLWQQLAAASLEELRSIPSVHPQRADILPAGVLLLRAAIDVLGVDAAIVSTRGLRYGAFWRLVERHEKFCR
jgi:exopolyphosphatase/guanosine-5'-triphosphate,3'-diphosphate pyrophosphatase